jgi:hypothetical protein
MKGTIDFYHEGNYLYTRTWRRPVERQNWIDEFKKESKHSLGELSYRIKITKYDGDKWPIKVRIYDLKGQFLQEFDTMMDAARKMKTSCAWLHSLKKRHIGKFRDYRIRFVKYDGDFVF